MHYFYTHAAGALIPAEGRAAHVPVVDAIGVVGGGLGGAWLGGPVGLGFGFGLGCGLGLGV